MLQHLQDFSSRLHLRGQDERRTHGQAHSAPHQGAFGRTLNLSVGQAYDEERRAHCEAHGAAHKAVTGTHSSAHSSANSSSHSGTYSAAHGAAHAAQPTAFPCPYRSTNTSPDAETNGAAHTPAHKQPVAAHGPTLHDSLLESFQAAHVTAHVTAHGPTHQAAYFAAYFAAHRSAYPRDMPDWQFHHSGAMHGMCSRKIQSLNPRRTGVPALPIRHHWRKRWRRIVPACAARQLHFHPRFPLRQPLHSRAVL